MPTLSFIIFKHTPPRRSGPAVEPNIKPTRLCPPYPLLFSNTPLRVGQVPHLNLTSNPLAHTRQILCFFENTLPRRSVSAVEPDIRPAGISTPFYAVVLIANSRYGSNGLICRVKMRNSDYNCLNGCAQIGGCCKLLRTGGACSSRNL